MKVITEKRLSKRLREMDKEDLSLMIMKIYHSSKQAKILISQYMSDETYHEEILNAYIEKVDKAFMPERGMPHPEKAESLVKEYIQSVCTEDKNEGLYLQACMRYAFVKDCITILSDFGEGPDHLYKVTENYFQDICDYIVSGDDAYRRKFMKQTEMKYQI